MYDYFYYNNTIDHPITHARDLSHVINSRYVEEFSINFDKRESNRGQSGEFTLPTVQNEVGDVLIGDIVRRLFTGPTRIIKKEDLN